MPLAVRHPEAVATAGSHSNGAGFPLPARNVAAATATPGLPPTVVHDVSALTATQFDAHAVRYGAERPTPSAPGCGYCGAGKFKLR